MKGKVAMMKAALFPLMTAMALLAVEAPAQSVLFDFDSTAAHTTLPIMLTSGDLTADFSGTGDSFSVQSANVLGFTPVGFSGNCLSPGGVAGGDLHVTFSRPITSFSVLYAPEEYACDSSATMRVTAYSGGNFVGTTTTNAQAGTWPTETLQFSSAQSFDSVVVHYDAAPATGGDYGTIFMADNVNVTPVPPPIVLIAQWVPGPPDGFQINFAGPAGTAFSVLTATNLLQPPANWEVLGLAAEISSGQYQYTDSSAAGGGCRFYCVRGG